MKKIFLSFLIVFFSTGIAKAQHDFLTVGLKVGYAFGQSGGLVMGIEGSYFHLAGDGKSIGAVISIDGFKEDRRLHLGIESNFKTKAKDVMELAGFEVGPTILMHDGGYDIGIGATPYFGVFIIPYYSFTFYDKDFQTHEAGTYLKLPFLVKGEIRF